ncbi:MAG TPA: hypothetical protein VEI97_11685, partial [bacterium]|nr:hypothetical protein [bacterium]
MRTQHRAAVAVLCIGALVLPACNKTAEDTNDPPRITGITASPAPVDGRVPPEEQLSLNAVFTDSADELERPQEYRYSWQVAALPGTTPPANLPASLLVNDDNPAIWMAPTQEGTYRLTVQICDPYGACASDSLSLVVDRDAAPNTAPRITSASVDTLNPSVGQPVTFTVAAEDADGDPLTFDWARTAGSFQSIGEGTAVWVGSQT